MVLMAVAMALTAVLAEELAADLTRRKQWFVLVMAQP
jgi:hypothetical protein